MMAMALHSRWMNVDMRTIHATGGASTNRAMLQAMADVFGADVFQLDAVNSACLGAALCAVHADALFDRREVAWEEIVRGVAEPIATSRLQPDSARHAMYRELTGIYGRCEAHALGRGPDPAPLLEGFRAQSGGWTAKAPTSGD